VGGGVVRWRRRQRRLVRLHLEVDQSARVSSIEGVLEGVVDGHYLIRAGKALAGSEESWPLDGDTLVPARRVVFIQTIGTGGNE